MTLVKGNIWDFHAQGHWICITTNGFVKANGECVMGRGTAAQAAKRFPSMPKRLGGYIRAQGNHVMRLYDLRIVTFPVKHAWFDKKADMKLIVQSAQELVEATKEDIYLPKPGCGCGNLQWSSVYPAIQTILKHERFKVVELSS